MAAVAARGHDELGDRPQDDEIWSQSEPPICIACQPVDVWGDYLVDNDQRAENMGDTGKFLRGHCVKFNHTAECHYRDRGLDAFQPEKGHD